MEKGSAIVTTTVNDALELEDLDRQFDHLATFALLRRPLCGPCYRERGGTGSGGLGIPGRDDLDEKGGIYAFCEGCNKLVHIDHLGEPFDLGRYAVIVVERVAQNSTGADLFAGHSLFGQQSRR